MVIEEQSPKQSIKITNLQLIRLVIYIAYIYFENISTWQYLFTL